jgi:hypothetical protein
LIFNSFVTEERNSDYQDAESSETFNMNDGGGYFNCYASKRIESQNSLLFILSLNCWVSTSIH